jgi:ethanolamine utilization protein EutQ (cupin superfamily)
MENEQQAFVVGPGEGRCIDLGDFAMTLKADTDDTAGLVSYCRRRSHRGSALRSTSITTPLRFYVLEGEYIMYLDDREFTCAAGSFIFIPLGVRHGFKVGDVPSRKLNFYFPAAMIGYFDDLAAALGRNDINEMELAGIARIHSMEIVGPPSER